VAAEDEDALATVAAVVVSSYGSSEDDEGEAEELSLLSLFFSCGMAVCERFYFSGNLAFGKKYKKTKESKMGIQWVTSNDVNTSGVTSTETGGKEGWEGGGKGKK
jgi:hypothetical protein